MTRDQIVEIARSWIGTPYHHQARLKGVGVDCIGLIVGVGRELGLQIEDTTDYARYPDGKTLGLELERQFIKTDVPRLGDILLFRVTRLPQHVGICSPIGLIHAHMGVGRVVETGISKSWRDRMLGAYKFPGVKE